MSPVLVSLLPVVLTASLAAQEPYRQPPPIVQRVLDAPSLPALSPSPDGALLLLADREGLPSIADLAQPMLRLAGLRINPRTNDRFSVREFTGLTIQETATGRERRITAPDGARLSLIGWSPDGRRVAFVTTIDSGLVLWVADAASGQATRLTGPVLNGVTGGPCSWMPASPRLLCRFVPAGRGAPPEPPLLPAGPIVQRTEGTTAPVRTYQDLLESPYDEALFAYYATSQLAIIDATTGTRTDLGAPGIFLQADPAPGSDLFLVTRATRPFSYLVPVWSFTQETEVWTSDGSVVVDFPTVPVAEEVPVGGVRTGARSAHWRPFEPATLIWIEALDGGDTRSPAEWRDRVVALSAPFTAPVELGRLSFRYAGVRYGRDGLALLSEYERATRHARTWRLNTDRPQGSWRILFDYATEDRYNDPGDPVMTRNAAGDGVLLQSADGNAIYLIGAGASPQGERPFVDRYRLDQRRAERLWQSPADAYERPVDVLNPAGTQVVTRRETRTTPPNYVLRGLGTPGSERAITRFENPAPELAGLRRELVTYRRGDGVGLSGTLYYPTDWQEGRKVPVVFWIYPREFATADAAGQVQGSPNRFVLPSGASHLFLLTQGYAVLDNPTLPVIGSDTANNTYVEQTVAGAEAAVAYLTERGIADGSFGVGGHSYGAFATANLLAHSDLFKAGVARSGAYNRTLTPFGFQSEQRTFWQAPDVYLAMMPFAHADKVDEPILLIHGMADNNSGTFPVQSERMYHALKGHGATVEYVQLPYESHGYAARESVGDVIARMIEWFDRYVKEAAAASE